MTRKSEPIRCVSSDRANYAFCLELKEKPPLKLAGEVLADIFLGKIDKWNDPALQKLNHD